MPLPRELKMPAHYSNFGLSENPFKIEPLFREFRNKDLCKQHEELFVPPANLNLHLKNLCTLTDRRCLIYGGYGVGKTSLVDMILYIACNFHHRFCLRVVVTEDNVGRAINEMLSSICLQVIDEITSRPLSHPIIAIRKWLLERKSGDNLLKTMAKLIGTYGEESSEVVRKRKKEGVKASLAGVEASLNLEQETETRRAIQSFINILPMPTVHRYMEDMLLLTGKIGYEGIYVFIDEADHLPRIDEFLKMLTRTREVLFAKGFTFFIAGSPEIARHVESMGIIFDKVLFMEPASRPEFEEILNARIHANNPKLKLTDIFTNESLDLIYQTSKGMRKQFIRLAENSLDIAVAQEASQITSQHVWEVIGMAKDHIQLTLSVSQSRVIRGLAQLGSSSPSNTELQSLGKLKRVALRAVLEELVHQGYVNKEKKGRTSLYSIAAAYMPYFKGNDAR